MRAAWLVAALAACQSRTEPAPAPVVPDAAVAAIVEPAGPADAAEAEPAETGPSAAPDPDDEEMLAAPGDLGAIPAWRAVIDRDRYLARRGDRGVVAGRVGGPVPESDLVWLIDETEGNGALGIRIRFAKAPEPGARVAVRGAWTLDEARRWYWQADAVTPLPAIDEPAPKDPPAPPGHVIAAADPPGGWGKVKAPDKASPGDLMMFTVVSTPRREGDGWGVSDRRWGTLMATLRLPGEHDSYGGHDLRAADERWGLDKGKTYWVRVGKVRRPPDGVPLLQAVTAPVRIP